MIGLIASPGRSAARNTLAGVLCAQTFRRVRLQQSVANTGLLFESRKGRLNTHPAVRRVAGPELQSETPTCSQQSLRDDKQAVRR